LLWVFESRVLMKIIGPKGDEGTGEWKKLHSEEQYDAYCSPYIVRVIKSRRTRMGGGPWWGNLGGRRPLGRPKSSRSSKRGMGVWTGLIWLRIGTGAGLL
jgi:hypothetical protein